MIRCLCVLAVVLAVAHAEVSIQDQDGYFQTRSGNVILKDLRAKADPAMAIQHSKFIQPNDQPRVSLYAVADFIASAMGLPKLTHSVTDNVAGAQYTGDVLHRPAANMMFAVSSLGKADLKSRHLDSISNLFSSEKANAVDLINGAYPSNAAGYLTSLSTGARPSDHGVVGSFWTKNGVTHRAFASSETASTRPHLADLMSRSFNGESFILSVSADPTLAGATFVHGRTKNSLRMSFDERTMSLRASSRVYQDLQIPFSALQEFLNSKDTIWSALEVHGVSVSRAGDKFVVRAGSEEAIFATEDSMVLFELFAMHQLPSLLASHERVKPLLSDSTPDFYAVTISSLLGVANKFGSNSPQYQVASRLVDQALPLIMKKYQDLYQRDSLTEVVLLGSHAADDEHRVQGAETKLAELVAQFSNEPATNILHSASALTYNLDLSASSFSKFCSIARSQLKSEGFEVLCPSHDFAANLLEITDAHGRIDLQRSVFTNSTTGLANTSAQRYQIVLWLVIILVFAIYASVYAIAYMDLKKDPLLYSRFNPNWNGKKTN